MSNTPHHVVEAIERQKPRLMIIEDQPAMLGRFVSNFNALGYEVIPVLVAQPDKDRFFQNGRINRTELDDEIAAIKADGQAWSSLMYYEAMAHFEYGVKNRAELAVLFQTLKPDLVLSDERLRLDRKNIAAEEIMAEDNNVIRGSDVMRMAKELLPDVPRAIHTAIYDAVFAPVPKSQQAKAKAAGHMIFAKDDYEAENQPQAELIHRYFQKALQPAAQRD